MEDMGILVKKFSKFMKRSKGTRVGTIRRFIRKSGTLGHVKVGYPTLKKNPFKEKLEKKKSR
ncbi:hypothetical protein Lal_00041653 [Lupinus albus]|nr:hypothetical protein Lal_00041653 [Lupinus albus]